MLGKCKLYGTYGELRESHIFPKFAIKYMKKTGSKYFRSAANPNKRMEDGVKEYLLSERAEQLFSKRENWFKKKLFIPYLDSGKGRFQYDENLSFFSISFLWRILVSYLDKQEIISKPYYDILKKVEIEWRSYLLTMETPRNYNQLHLFLSDRISSDSSDLPEGIDMYITRACDAAIGYIEECDYLFVYGKFLKFIFWGFIKGGDETKMIRTKISFGNGLLERPQSIQDENLGQFIINTVKALTAAWIISPKQENIIENEIQKDLQKVLNSDGGQSWINDGDLKNRNADNRNR